LDVHRLDRNSYEHKVFQLETNQLEREGEIQIILNGYIYKFIILRGIETIVQFTIAWRTLEFGVQADFVMALVVILGHILGDFKSHFLLGILWFLFLF
jgi:hypothetical protein